MIYHAELAASSNSKCYGCEKAITKDEIRVRRHDGVFARFLCYECGKEDIKRNIRTLQAEIKLMARLKRRLT